ncbi:MAG: hypothetical protein DRR19_28930 [Candidatus Parabeggiatoa sp. nov. 1]|nr:MAG: hypothetical protein DRR19_28930 [Gammaproteobacteria bacterium]
MKKEFTDLLNKYTDEANITAKALAGAIGVSESTMKKWRCYENSPRKRENVLAMAKCLNLTEAATNEFLKAAGFKPEYIFVDLPLAKRIFTEDIRGVFNHTLPRLTYPVILLLNQADWAQPPCREALLAQARKIYPPNNVLHIWLPSSLGAYVNKLFSSLGKQCGFSEVEDDSDFEQALGNRLKNSTDELFLLVSRFEQGAQSLGEQLAHILRSLSDQYAQRLHLILCGGEKLERLKYGEGELSLLNIAEDKRWPELGLSEVKALAKYRFNDLRLDDDLANELLAISGGHPQLLSECLTLQQQEPILSLANYPDRLSHSQYARQGFTPFIQNKSARQQVSKWLQQDDLGTFTHFIDDNLLRKLYWKNLLTVREVGWEKRLCWRCEALKMAGQKILAGQYQPSLTGEDNDDGEES